LIAFKGLGAVAREANSAVGMTRTFLPE